MAKPSARATRSILSSGLLTALSMAVVTGLSAAVGIVIAREFGRGVETDGFFAAYGVFLVLVLAASAVRVAVLPSLARARAAGSFGSVVTSYAVALGLVAVPALLLSLLASGWAAAQLASRLSRGAARRRAAAERPRDRRGCVRLPRSGGCRAPVRRACGERARRLRQLRHGRSRLRARQHRRSRGDPLARR